MRSPRCLQFSCSPRLRGSDLKCSAFCFSVLENNRQAFLWLFSIVWLLTFSGSPHDDFSHIVTQVSAADVRDKLASSVLSLWIKHDLKSPSVSEAWRNPTLGVSWNLTSLWLFPPSVVFPREPKTSLPFREGWSWCPSEAFVAEVFWIFWNWGSYGWCW